MPRNFARIAAYAATSAVLACLLLLAAGPILTDDLWWHLAMGRAYAAGGPWLTADPLLHTAHASGPVQHEWLFGVLAHGIERLGGFHGLRIAHALAVLGIAALAHSLIRREARIAELAALGTGIFLVLAWWRLMQARPDLASIAATLVCYRLLIEPERRVPSWARVGGFAALAALWANLHSLFAIVFPLGLAAVLGLAARGLAARRLGEQAAAFSEDFARARRVGIGLVLAAIASLLNPRGLAQHLTFFSSSRGAAIWQVRDEWRPFDPFHFGAEHESLGWLEWWTADVLLAAFVAAALTGAVRFLRAPSERSLRAVDPVLYALGCASIAALLVSVRFLWLGIFPLLCLLRTTRELGLASRAAPACALAAVALALAFPTLSSWWVVRSTQPQSLAALGRAPYLAHKYAVPGVRMLRDSGIEGNLFNSYGSGGFLGYWLSPALRTFVDGRTEHYPPAVLDDYLAVVNRNPTDARGLAEILDERGVDVFFGFGLPNDVPRHGMRYTAGHLLGADDWVVVSSSVLHRIWLRRDDRENLERAAAYYAAREVPFDRSRGFEPARVLAQRPDWAIEANLVPAEYPQLVAAYRDGSATRDELRRLAVVLALVGAHEQQLEVDFAYEEAHGADAGSQRRIVYALLQLGLYEEAHTIAQSLPALAPEPPHAENERTARQLEAVARTAGQLAFHRLREQRQAGAPLPVTGLDRFPLLSPEEMQWILDAQRTLVLPIRTTAP
ncbi:MAG: hypothetical protein VX681_04050 [Myxococcota bacterium]|nr:hypothetical protein [Myxococcota bacterium]